MGHGLAWASCLLRLWLRGYGGTRLTQPPLACVRGRSSLGAGSAGKIWGLDLLCVF